MIVVFKQQLNDGIRRCCTVDEFWNWEGDKFIIQSITQVLRSYNITSIEQLPDIFYGVYFWASIENIQKDERKGDK